MDGFTSFSTDGYQFTMMYAYYKANMHTKISTNEYFFRQVPFNQYNYCILGGIRHAIYMIKNFKYTDEEIKLLAKKIRISEDDPFFEYLRNFDSNKLSINYIKEGSLVFPFQPLLALTGPVIYLNLLDDRIMNVLNFSTLIATKASIFRYLLKDKLFLELGSRRAQGPNGSNLASEYSYIGGADGSSNMQVVIKYDLYFDGSMSHNYVLSFKTFDNQLYNTFSTDIKENIYKLIEFKNKNDLFSTVHEGELSSFLFYYLTFNKLAVLIDTYSTFESGLKNYYLVAYFMQVYYNNNDFTFRIDSGDLYEESKKARNILKEYDSLFKTNIAKYSNIFITNKLDLKEVKEIEDKPDNEVNIYGIGTNLVTSVGCNALGVVGKQVMFDGKSSLKLDKNKKMFPFKKTIIRCILNCEQYKFIDYFELPDIEVDYNIKHINLYNYNNQSTESFDIKELYILNNDNNNKDNYETDINKIRDYVVKQIKENNDNIKNKFNSDLYFSLNYLKEYNIIVNNL